MSNVPGSDYHGAGGHGFGGSHDSRMPSLEELLESWRSKSLIVGVAGTIVCAIGAFMTPQRFFPSYLVAYLFWLAPTMGAWIFTLIHTLSGGMWGQVIRRSLRAALPTTMLFAPLFLPIGFGMKHIYPWAQIGGETSAATASPDASPVLRATAELGQAAVDHELAAKLDYLNPTMVWMRAGVIFIIWIVMTYLLERWSWGDNPSSSAERRSWAYRLGGPSLICYCLTMLVASTDWSMSIQPDWYSAMYGITFWAMHAITGLSFAVLVTAYLSKYEPFAPLDKPRHWGDLGSLMFTATMFWTYTAFMQFLIIYAGNLPIEGAWFVARNNGLWIWESRALVVLHFFAPFMCLLMRPIKRNRQYLSWVAMLIIAMQLVEFHWLVIPSLWPETFTLHWTTPFAVIAIGGWWLWLFASRLQANVRQPIYDPELEKAIHAGKQDHADLSVAAG